MEFLDDLFGDLLEGKKKHKGNHGDKNKGYHDKNNHHDDNDDDYDNRDSDKRKYVVKEEQSSAICTNCSAKIVQGAKFCGRCGMKINEAKHCTDCGTKMQNDASFCQNCGKKN
ncbi:MAG TPA: hypothetical protein DEP72_08610 [Clostridiales bacterium]|nr:MAG: hypothetical protein A2Y18_07210 [Clostridiales bacterium GWD2_32_19]HCC08199.1 hypothetical protein [Clostridiales bacterium]